MLYKALTINSKFPVADNQVINDIIFQNATLQTHPTLHDFHIIIVDMDEIFSSEYWQGDKHFDPDVVRSKFQEQIVSGGVVICFSGEPKTMFSRNVQAYHNIQKSDDPRHSLVADGYLSNYFFCPIPLGIKNENGVTFSFVPENLKNFKPLMKKIPTNDVFWRCYFSNIPEFVKPLGINRAGYAVFIEASLGEGKLVMLPSFKNKNYVFKLLFEEIIPQMIKEENLGQMEPKWLTEMEFQSEIMLKQKLSQIRSAKQLISTNGRALEKAVMSTFSLMGYQVEKMNTGSHADIRITDKNKNALVEVKGHRTRQANRTEFNQLFAYLAEIENPPKGIMVVNHEFGKPLNDRNEFAFTSDLISLANKADIALISSVELFGLAFKIIENKVTNDQLIEIRQAILNGSGIINLQFK